MLTTRDQLEQRLSEIEAQLGHTKDHQFEPRGQSSLVAECCDWKPEERLSIVLSCGCTHLEHLVGNHQMVLYTLELDDSLLELLSQEISDYLENTNDLTAHDNGKKNCDLFISVGRLQVNERIQQLNGILEHTVDHLLTRESLFKGNCPDCDWTMPERLSESLECGCTHEMHLVANYGTCTTLLELDEDLFFDKIEHIFEWLEATEDYTRAENGFYGLLLTNQLAEKIFPPFMRIFLNL